jgi:Nif-specific regulatory protein
MRARLTVEAGSAKPPVVELSPETTVNLGRNPKNTIRIDDAKASRLHAEVYFHDGAWHIRNRSTTNATRLDGERIRQPVRLRAGQIIGVGEVRLRFDPVPAAEDGSARGEAAPSSEARLVAVRPADPAKARLDPDELTTLLRFMNNALAETTPHGLVLLALRAIRQQTEATVCGYLSFDAEDPGLKVVLPSGAEVNATLSQQLTMKVKSEGTSAWLNAPEREDDTLQSASLAAYADAVCVVLPRNPAADPAGWGDDPRPLGALHAYHAARRFSEREVRFCEVLAGCLANSLHVLRTRRVLEADNSRLRDRAGRDDELVGDSPAIAKLRAEVAALAASPCTVLIEGESGVGKELVALALHRLSTRGEGPLVTVNCAALSTGVSEAELFGHEKGAFTSADRARPGLFQQADEGTIFLDEIGELPPDAQGWLLRVLESKRVRPLLSKSEIRVDVRILAATNRDLDKEMRAGRFRRDLFYRLGARLRVPPLREHAEDIPALAAHFLNRLNLEHRRGFRLAPEALERLRAYAWPGNVRQLRTVLEAAVVTTGGDVLRPSDLRLGGDGGPDSEDGCLNLEVLEARAIREAVARTGVLVHAARLLGIHRETLINKMKKFGIERPRHDGPEDNSGA